VSDWPPIDPDSLALRELDAIGTSFDNAGYISIARDVRSGHLSDLTPKLSWGTSYAIAAVSIVFRVPEYVALLAISVLCSGGVIWLVFRIWGAWIAAFFLVLNLPWIQLTFEGGSEPLFVFLIFASLFLAREEKWLWAAFFSSLATIVRPAGFFALAAVGLVLLYQKHYRELLRRSHRPLGWPRLRSAAVGPFWRSTGHLPRLQS
jgi:hypothetical protein